MSPFDRAEVIKCEPGRDLYVAWSHEYEAPAWVGTRAQALTEGCEAGRLERADETGSSYHLFSPWSTAPVPGCRWGKDGLMAEQLGLLPRARLAGYTAAYFRGRYRRAYMMLERLEPCRPREHRRRVKAAVIYWRREDRAARRRGPLAGCGRQYRRRQAARTRRRRG